jgi:hypothetical protein
VTSRVIEVAIDEVVLDGFGRVDPDRVAASAARELERLFAASGLRPGPGRSVAVAPAPPVPTKGTSAEALGVALAREVHRGLAP